MQCRDRSSMIYAFAALWLCAAAPSHPAVADTAGPAVPLPAADQKELETLLGTGVVGEALPSAPLADPDIYLPRKGAQMIYQVLEGGKKAAIQTQRIDDATEAPYAPGWRYSIEKEGAIYFKKMQDGSVQTVAEEDLDHKVLSRFTPSEPLIIPGLKPGESRKSSVKIEVYDLSNLNKVTHSGSLDVTYTYVGTYRVTVPAGTYDAALVKWDYAGTVGPADIKDSQYRFLAPGAGMVAMIQIRSISAMLIYNDHTKRGKVLEQAP